MQLIFFPPLDHRFVPFHQMSKRDLTRSFEFIQMLILGEVQISHLQEYSQVPSWLGLCITDSCSYSWLLNNLIHHVFSDWAPVLASCLAHFISCLGVLYDALLPSSKTIVRMCQGEVMIFIYPLPEDFYFELTSDKVY